MKGDYRILEITYDNDGADDEVEGGEGGTNMSAEDKEEKDA